MQMKAAKAIPLPSSYASDDGFDPEGATRPGLTVAYARVVEGLSRLEQAESTARCESGVVELLFFVNPSESDLAMLAEDDQGDDVDDDDVYVEVVLDAEEPDELADVADVADVTE